MCLYRSKDKGIKGIAAVYLILSLSLSDHDKRKLTRLLESVLGQQGMI